MNVCYNLKFITLLLTFSLRCFLWLVLMHCLHHPDVELVMVVEGLGWVEVTPGCRYTVELALGLHRMSNFCCHCFTQNTSKTTKIFLFLLFYYHTDSPRPKLLIQDPLGELWVVVVQSLSCVPLFATPWTVAHQTSLSSLSPRVFSNLCPFSQWCHPTISSFVTPFSSYPQSLPASGSFPMSQLFASGGQSLELQLQHQSFQWIFRIDFL